MTTSNFLEAVLIFLVPFLFVLVSIYIGQRYGTYRKRQLPEMQDSVVSSVVGAVFGLLAFILAFAFQIAANHYDARKVMLLEEVTNIRSTYLQAGLIQEPICSETRSLLVEYVELRIELSRDPSKLASVMSRSQEILYTLWGFTESLAKLDRSSEAYSLYTSSVNDLVTSYNKRITLGLEYRINPTVFGILFIITICSMLALGYQFGISGKGNLKLGLVLATIFAAVIFMIIALDRPELGIINVNQKPMYTLQKQLQTMKVPD